MGDKSPKQKNRKEKQKQGVKDEKKRQADAAVAAKAVGSGKK